MADKQNLAKESQLALKQDTLIAGANITIAPDGKTISAAGPTSITVTPIYQAGTLVAAIVVNGNTTNIYAPAQHGDNSNQNLAAPFSASATYAVGDYVIYQENLYKCITAITTAAAWDATKWTRVLITNEMGSGSGGDYANQNIADTYDITATYDVGDYVIFNSLLYKCITAVTTPGVWNSSYWAHVLVTNEMGSGGGSSVIPNPQDPATDTLTTIEINGTVYDIAGGGGGSGYTETTLWSGSETPSTSGSDINLSDNISGYDAIAIHVGNSSYTGDNIFLVSSLTIGETYISTIYHGENLGAYFTYTSDAQINIKSQGSYYPQTYTEVIGIKYGSGGGGGGNSNDRELTWDEYQALPDAEKYNDTNYYITDVNSDGTSNEFQPIIYSENEREIGVWTDGKPLYEKTFHYTTLNASRNDWTILEAFTLDKFIDVSVLFTDDNDRYLDEAYMRISYYNGNLYYHTPESSGTCNNVYVTIQYTKATDQPGSGTWTPQGVPAVHYDDNEKVIGTWFGETLYERVYDFSSSLIYIDTSYTTISAIDTTNIDKVIYCCAMHQDGTVYPAVDADPTRDNHTYMGLKSFDSHSNVAYVIIRYTKSSS